MEESPEQNPSRSSAGRRRATIAASLASLLVCACQEPQLGSGPVAASSAAGSNAGGSSAASNAGGSAGGSSAGTAGLPLSTLPAGAGNTAVGVDTRAAAARASTPSAAPQAAAPGLDAGVDLASTLRAPDGTPLAQTRDRPSTESPSFRLRLERLVDAIMMDDPERAMPAFFPRIAYEQVKAVADPGRDWQQRLVAAFRRDIHEYHRALGPDAARAKLAGIVTNENAVRWIEPGKEGNRLGYYRVTRSRLRFRWGDGSERQLELTSLISWRGEWYVVHLHGFG